MKPDPRVKAIAARIEKLFDFRRAWWLSEEEFGDHVVTVSDRLARDILAYLARRELTLLKKARKSARR